MRNAALYLAAALWFVWGCVHAFAGALIISGDATSGFQAIADAVDPSTLVHAYEPAVEGVLNQHAWNLLWGGVVTIVGAFFVARGVWTGIWVTAMVGGLLDVGYFVFIDLGGFANFFPGTLMTIFSASAIVLSFGAAALGGRSA